MATVEIKLGDMFGGPADLIVLPCSTGGSTTNFVARRLAQYNISPPNRGMSLGSVEIRQFMEGANFAQYVAFAYSVHQNNSSLEAITAIGEILGKSTTDNSAIRAVSCPLLGAGAGHLGSENVVRALTKGFKNTAHAAAQLTIFVLHQNVFERIGREQGLVGEERKAAADRPLRVFVSYSHSTSSSDAWVEQLGRFLRENGIDARLDIWHLGRGMELAQFMTNELALAERVLIVSDKRYVEKADGRIGGVGWETATMQSDPDFLRPESKKYLVIVRSADYNLGVPRHLKPKFGLHWPSTANENQKRQELLRDLLDEIRAPVLGPKPVYV